MSFLNNTIVKELTPWPPLLVREGEAGFVMIDDW